MAQSELGALVHAAGGAVEVADVHPLEFAAEVAPGVAGARLSDAAEQQREEGEQHVGADAVFLAVVDRA